MNVNVHDKIVETAERKIYNIEKAIFLDFDSDVTLNLIPAQDHDGHGTEFLKGDLDEEEKEEFNVDSEVQCPGMIICDELGGPRVFAIYPFDDDSLIAMPVHGSAIGVTEMFCHPGVTHHRVTDLMEDPR